MLDGMPSNGDMRDGEYPYAGSPPIGVANVGELKLKLQPLELSAKVAQLILQRLERRGGSRMGVLLGRLGGRDLHHPVRGQCLLLAPG